MRPPVLGTEPAAPGLEFEATLADRGFDVRLQIAAGETVALLGPNGAGKSTLLEAIAGLVLPDAARIVLGERVLSESGSSRSGAWVPTHARSVGLLAQEPRLFPHLSVRDNVAFGPRSLGASRREAAATSEDWLARVGMLHLADRRPTQLSGGQAQRVAIARALAAEPRLILLDEPLAALDVDSVPALRTVLAGVLSSRTAIIATHDVLDAIQLADRVAVIEEGRLVEYGPTHEVLSRPTSAFAARIAGLNLLSGVWDGTAVVTESGLAIRGHLADASVVVGTPLVAVFRPSAVAIYPDALAGSPRNSFPVTVEGLEPLGELIRVRTAAMGADVTPAAAAELQLSPGTRVHFVVKAAEVELYPASPAAG